MKTVYSRTHCLICCFAEDGGTPGDDTWKVFLWKSFCSVDVVSLSCHLT